MPVLIQTKTCNGPCGATKSVTEFWRDASQSDGYMAKCSICTQMRREEIAALRAAGKDVRPTFSLEERKVRSDRAKQLHAEGRLGGSAFGRMGGRPAKVKITDGLLEYFRQDNNFQLVLRAFESSLRSNSKTNRLAAAKAIVSMEQVNDELDLKRIGAGKRPEDMTKEELHAFLEQSITAMIERGEVGVAGLQSFTLPESAIHEDAAA